MIVRRCQYEGYRRKSQYYVYPGIFPHVHNHESELRSRVSGNDFWTEVIYFYFKPAGLVKMLPIVV